jgi:hypothetical protein
VFCEEKKTNQLCMQERRLVAEVSDKITTLRRNRLAEVV